MTFGRRSLRVHLKPSLYLVRKKPAETTAAESRSRPVGIPTATISNGPQCLSVRRSLRQEPWERVNSFSSRTRRSICSGVFPIACKRSR